MACRVVFDLFFDFIGLISGFVGFILLNFYYYNYGAGLLSLYAGILACIGFHLHHLYTKNSLHHWYSYSIYKSIEVLAVIGILIGAGFGGWIVFSYYYYHDDSVSFYKSKMMTLIWAVLNFVYGIHLFDTLRRYSRLSDEYQSILNGSSA